MRDDVKTILPGESAKVGEETVILRPFLFGDLPELIRIIGEMGADVFAIIGEMTTNDETDEITINPAMMQAIGDLVVKHFDSVAKIISMSTGKPVEWVKGLTLDAGIELLIGSIIQNASFFAERLPMLKEKVMKVAGTAKATKRKPQPQRKALGGR